MQMNPIKKTIYCKKRHLILLILITTVEVEFDENFAYIQRGTERGKETEQERERERRERVRERERERERERDTHTHIVDEIAKVEVDVD